MTPPFWKRRFHLGYALLHGTQRKTWEGNVPAPSVGELGVRKLLNLFLPFRIAIWLSATVARDDLRRKHLLRASRRARIQIREADGGILHLWLDHIPVTVLKSAWGNVCEEDSTHRDIGEVEDSAGSSHGRDAPIYHSKQTLTLAATSSATF